MATAWSCKIKSRMLESTGGCQCIARKLSLTAGRFLRSQSITLMVINGMLYAEFYRCDTLIFPKDSAEMALIAISQVIRYILYGFIGENQHILCLFNAYLIDMIRQRQML